MRDAETLTHSGGLTGGIDHWLDQRRRWIRAAFILAVVVTLVAALMPQVPGVGAGNDKLHHVLAFAALTGLASAAWIRAPAYRLALALAGLGGAIEVLQMAMPFGRSGEWLDFAADCAAIVVTLAVVALARRL